MNDKPIYQWTRDERREAVARYLSDIAVDASIGDLDAEMFLEDYHEVVSKGLEYKQKFEESD